MTWCLINKAQGYFYLFTSGGFMIFLSSKLTSPRSTSTLRSFSHIVLGLARDFHISVLCAFLSSPPQPSWPLAQCTFQCCDLHESLCFLLCRSSTLNWLYSKGNMQNLSAVSEYNINGEANSNQHVFLKQ
jgi:hypothetical protein